MIDVPVGIKTLLSQKVHHQLMGHGGKFVRSLQIVKLLSPM